MTWSVKKQNDIVRIDVPFRARKDWEQWFLLTSDRHWDNPKSDRDLQLRHLDLARERKAIILDLGDFFCAMQGKYDPRRSKSAVREEHDVDNYLDALVDSAHEWFDPYHDMFAMVASGNHEAAILKNCESDLIERLMKPWPGIASPITGFIKVAFAEQGKSAERFHYLVHWHHGYGGGGPVTRDVIQTARKAVYLSDADIVLSGHSHDAWSLPIRRLVVSPTGYIKTRYQHHIKVPTYKDDYALGATNWSNLKGHPPKPLGCVWLRFYYSRKGRRAAKGKKEFEGDFRRIRFDTFVDVGHPDLEM